MTTDANFLDDEIDIRQLLRALFRYKWVILGITLVAAIVVFVYLKFGSPKQYAAQVQVLFTKPLFTTNLDTSIQNMPQIPEASVLKELALDDGLLYSVYTSTYTSMYTSTYPVPASMYTLTVVTAALGKNVDFEKFKTGMGVKLTGTSKLYLVVSSDKPEASFLIVNVWAEQFIKKINALYSVNIEAQTQIDYAALKASNTYNDAEIALMQEITSANVNTQKIELANKQNSLATYLGALTQLDLIITDTQNLMSSLAIWPDDSQLAIEYQISLIGLYQRATSWLESSQIQGATAGLASAQIPGVQVQIAIPTTENLRTIGEAIASLEALIKSLGDQKKPLQSRQKQLSEDIANATLALESANYKLTQLTSNRDLALNTYQALAAQKAETNTNLPHNNEVAKLVGPAVLPEQPVSNRTLLKTVIVAALAFVVSCFGVLLINWWKSPAPAKLSSVGKK